jgi:hypothetical protein
MSLCAVRMWNSGAGPNFLPAQLKPPLTRSRYFRGGTVGNQRGSHRPGAPARDCCVPPDAALGLPFTKRVTARHLKSQREVLSAGAVPHAGPVSFDSGPSIRASFHRHFMEHKKGRPKDALNFSDPLPIDERPLCRSPRRNAGFHLIDRSWRLALALTPRALVPLRRARGSSFERAQ